MIDLKGKKAVIIGVANASSIAYGCAKVLSDLGAELCITYATVRSHMTKIYEKLHVTSMTEAVAKAINQKLLSVLLFFPRF